MVLHAMHSSSTRRSSHRRSNVRRTNVTACMRCKSRKQRCDQSLPSCSSCEKAGVQCVSVDLDGRAIPRSYTRNLEDRVAFLEKQLTSNGIMIQDEDFWVSASSTVSVAEQMMDTEPNMEARPRAAERDNSILSKDIIGPIGMFEQVFLPPIGAPNIEFSEELSTTDRQAPRYQSLVEAIPCRVDVSMPAPDVARKLAGAYFEHSDFFSPILERSHFFEILDERIQNESNVEAHDLMQEYRLFMVFAVALQLLNRADSSIPLSRSEAYYNSAFSILGKNTASFLKGDLAHLETLLLLIQYTFFSADLPAAWHFVGLAVRLAVGLGLHLEGDGDVRDLGKRRRLFWVLYAFERSLAIVVQRPFSLPDEAIEAGYSSLRSSDKKKAIFNHLVLHRRLESEIWQTIHQKLPPYQSDFDLRSWKRFMEQQLLDWYATRPSNEDPSCHGPEEILEGLLNNSLVLLYSPSRHSLIVTDEELILLAKTASKSIDIYKKCFTGGNLRFYWRTCRNLFRAGRAVAYCIRSLFSRHNVDADYEAMRRSISTCSSVLWGMIERYRPGEKYRDAFENIAASVSNLPSLGGFHVYREAVGASQGTDTELQDLPIDENTLDALLAGYDPGSTTSWASLATR